jgi:hypothetical protein
MLIRTVSVTAVLVAMLAGSAASGRSQAPAEAKSGGAALQRDAELPNGVAPEVTGVLIQRSSREPLVGEKVMLCAVTFSSEGKRLVKQSVDWVKTTDSRGRFRFEHVPPGTYCIRARGMEAESAGGKGTGTVTVKVGDTKLDYGLLAVAAGQGAEVKGTLVAYETLRPIAGRQVLLCPVTTDEKGVRSLQLSLDFSSHTDAQGRFQIKGVPPGTYGVLSQYAELTTADGKGSLDVVIKGGESLDLGQIKVKSD